MPEDHLAAPTPLEEHRKLAVFAGEEMVYPSRGTGKTLTLVRGSLRGNARHVYEILDDNTYSMKIQFSPDAEGWADVLTGVYRRIN
jgi:hypothetical protein